MFIMKAVQVLLQHFDIDHFPSSTYYYGIILSINIMGTNTSKIKDILFVTGESLDSPDLHSPIKRKQTKEVQIDYKTFTNQSYYKDDATHSELNQHLQQLERKQNLLKQFKHHKDFDRIDYKKMNDQSAIFEHLSEDLIKLTVGAALLLSRTLGVQYLADYFTIGGWRRLFWPSFFTLVPYALWKAATCPEYQIINHEYFRMLPDEESMYVEFDQKFNLYKDVKDMKFYFKYSSLPDYFKTRRKTLESIEYAKKNWYKEMYLYEYGLKVDPFEEFMKEREQKRTGNWQILTSEEKKLIEKELKVRQESEKLS